MELLNSKTLMSRQLEAEGKHTAGGRAVYARWSTELLIAMELKGV